ncbi:mucin-3A [Sorex araneus]|uniref:mucin-3A n=1 Tax=Sorex araneus TaxID=42254 RepID=UPI00243400E5|nr:mucin-3A [Sorex araneus]
MPTVPVSVLTSTTERATTPSFTTETTALDRFTSSTSRPESGSPGGSFTTVDWMSPTTITPVTTQTPTTPRQPTTTTTTSPTTTPGTCDNGGTWMQGHCLCPPHFSGDHCELMESRCENGGQWDGKRCQCPATFYGSRCELVKEEVVLDTVEAEVGMEVSVDQDFSEDLKDPTSKAYEDFSNSFQSQMKKVYENVPGFEGVKIRYLSAGSIVVDYVVLLKLDFSAQLSDKYEKVKEVLREELQAASQDPISCQSNQTLCFKPDSIKVDNAVFKPDYKDLCRSAAAEGYEKFYFPLEENNKLRCVTNCTAGLPDTIDCNSGQCILEKSGPTCRCFSSSMHWYSGPRCEVAVSWRALFGGLAGAGAVLLLLLGTAVGFSVVQRRRASHRFRKDDSIWFDDCDERSAGTFTNLGFEHERAVMEGSIQVDLDTVDTSAKVPHPGSHWHLLWGVEGAALSALMARPPGSHLCLLVLLSQILPPAVATERDLAKLPKGPQDFTPANPNPMCFIVQMRP